MLIEKIEIKSPRNPNIFNVTIDGEIHKLHSEIIVKYGLATNGEIEQDVLNEILFESDVIIATNLAMNYISSRVISTKQLKDYLKNKGYKSNVIKRVIDKFDEYSILNDENYANCYISSKQNVMSKRAIQNKLMQKGVSKEIIENCTSEYDELPVAENIANKFLKNKEINEENINKLIRHLNYKGFNYEIISKILDKLKNT